ncbi:unnamed protein product [Arctia plantaginis]|uniref:5'-Nucleotidase C-terminal domain-containing protein n=1 Tax=Arctia plantaginis TaxID=874455 RepID=A0A8S1B5E9_ARCPL|nr:unnamed protein product [Arctia plantaginis]
MPAEFADMKPKRVLINDTTFDRLLQSLGNHEFDTGVHGLAPFIQNVTCPVLSANLILTKVPELEQLTNLKKSIVIEVAERRIGIVGYLTPDTKRLAVPNDVEYTDEILAIRKEVQKLQNEGIDIIIALGHSGYPKDLEIAREVEGVDLVIGGHTNTFLWNGTSPDSEHSQGPYPTYLVQESGKSVAVVQAYAYTKYLGKLHLTFNSNGDLINADGTPILLDNKIPQDSDVLEIINKYRNSLYNITEEVVGYTSVLLDGASCSRKECNLGNLITDAMIFRYAIDYTGEHWTDAPIAIIQAGGIRASISHVKMPANITQGELLTVMPFEGPLVTVTVNGSTLIKMIQHSVNNYNDLEASGPFLQYSGIKVVYDINKPKGSRLIKAEARCWACDVPRYSKIIDKDVYKIIMPGFVAIGGDGYKMFSGLPTKTLGYSELVATQYYIKRHSPIYTQIEGRITLLTDNFQPNTNSSSYISLGNHEFDEAVEGVVPFIRNLSSPVLAANLILEEVPELQNETNLFKSIIITKDSIKIGIIGYLTPETKYLAPKNKVEYEDEVLAIRKEVQNLKKQSVNIFIALGHSGIVKDLIIAKEVEDLDIVIGGHSNTFLWNSNTTLEKPETPEGPYPIEIKQTSGRTVRVVQAYAYTKYMGKLHLIFDPQGEIITCDGLPILLDQQIPRDPELLQTINKYKKDVDRINNEVVGQSLVFLNGLCRLRECNIGDIITDAMLNFTREKYHKQYPNVNIAVVHGGRIRTSITHSGSPFTLTRGDWITALPFSTTLSIITMNGTILKQSLEHSVSTWRTVDSTGQFQQISGMEVVYDLARPVGSRVVIAKAVCSNCSIDTKVEIKDDSEYKVLMPSFMADGGDGFTMFGNLSQEVLTYNELDSLLYYLNKYSPIKPQLDGRIKILNEDKIVNKADISIDNIHFIPSSGCLGNHELDDGVDGVIPFIRNLSSPVLAANLILDKVPELQKEKNLYKSIIITKDNKKIGIIGYLTPETKYLAAKNKVEYEDEILAIRKEIQHLKKQNVNILIALGHSGIVKDLIIAKEVEDLDIVIGGHSNTFLWNGNATSEKPETPQGPYPIEVKQASGRKVRVVQAYAYTKYIGKLHLIFDSQGEIIACDGLPILLDQQIPRDPELLQTLQNYKKDIDQINNEVVGQSLVFLDGFCRLSECNIGDLITDAMLNFTRENYPQQYRGVHIASITGGVIRSSIIDNNRSPFTLTRGDWINVLPFLNTLCIVTMNGSTLKQSLEHSVSTWSTVDKTGQFQQISGMEVVYDLARPVGSRVVIAKAVCSNCSGDTKLEIEDDYEYKVVMPLFIADGGDGYVMFENLSKDILPHSELDSVLYFVNKYSPVEPQLDGRIKILNQDKVDNSADISINNISIKPSSGDVPTINLKFYYVVLFMYFPNIYLHGF